MGEIEGPYEKQMKEAWSAAQRETRELRTELAEVKAALEKREDILEAERENAVKIKVQLAEVNAENERYLDRIRELTSMCDEVYDKLKASEAERELRETNRALELNATERLDKKAARIDNLENELARVVDERDALQARIDGAVRGNGVVSPDNTLLEVSLDYNFVFHYADCYADENDEVIPVLILKDERRGDG